jgi:hypothetical protein
MGSRLFDYWLARVRRHELAAWQQGRSSSVPHARKRQILLDYLRRYRLRTFVETGTYLGEMVEAIIGDVDAVFSIELDPWLFHRARRKFERIPKIQILLGDSAAVLPGLVERFEGPALFWLDAHFSGGVTGLANSQTPIVSELGTILSRPNTGNVVLVDDARAFTGAGDYPSLDELSELVKQLAPEYQIQVEDELIRLCPGEPAH